MARFLDTNVLVYAEDRDAGAKHEIARNLVRDLWERRDGVLSVQVLQELFVVIRKRRPRMPAAQALGILEEYLSWRVVENTGSLLLGAVRLHQSASLSFWDALVVQAALSAGCDRLYSEDLQAGRRFGSLEIVNPFKA